MNRLARTHTSEPLLRAIALVPATLIMMLGASCAQSAPNAGDFSGRDDGSNEDPSAASDSSVRTGSGSASGTGSGSGATVAAGDDGGTGGSDATTASPADDGGSDSGGSAGDGGTGGTTHDSGTSTDPDSGTGAERDSGTGSDSGGGPAHDAGSGATGSTCTQHDAVCSADNSGCNVGSYYLYDNQWNCGAGSGNDCGPESAYGCTDSDGTVSWVTTSNQPKGNTAVLSYPAMQDNFGSTPSLSSFKAITSTFTETSPGNIGDYEVAYDCWFNSNNANEFMVWVDTYKQVPAGNKVATGVALGGHTYDIYWAAGSGTDGTVSFWSKTNFKSGTVDLLQLFNYAAQHGWLPKDSTVGQIDFGTEVCSTDGQAATWTVSNYSVTTN